jgi:hypothetical protein
VNKELKGLLEGSVVAPFNYYIGMLLEGRRKTTNILNHDYLVADRDLNLEPREYGAELLIA